MSTEKVDRATSFLWTVSGDAPDPDRWLSERQRQRRRQRGVEEGMMLPTAGPCRPWVRWRLATARRQTQSRSPPHRQPRRWMLQHGSKHDRATRWAPSWRIWNCLEGSQGMIELPSRNLASTQCSRAPSPSGRLIPLAFSTKKSKRTSGERAHHGDDTTRLEDGGQCLATFRGATCTW